MDELVGFVDEQYDKSDKNNSVQTIESIVLHSYEPPNP
jgi:hypothetical protein